MVVFDELACALKLFVDRSVPEEIAYPVPEEAAKTGFTEALGTNTGASVHRVDRRDSTFEKIQCCELGSSLGEIIEFFLAHAREEWRIISPEFEVAKVAVTRHRRGKFDMGVGIDEAWHDQFPRSIDDDLSIQLHVCRLRRTHVNNFPVVDEDGPVLVEVLVVVDCHHKCIVNDQVGIGRWHVSYNREKH